VDTRFSSPGRDLVHDVATGAIDVGIPRGPIAGYYAKLETPPPLVTPLPAQEGPVQLGIRITMGMRPNEPERKRTINGLIRKKQKEIDQLLLGYGVPLLDEKG